MYKKTYYKEQKINVETVCMPEESERNLKV